VLFGGHRAEGAADNGDNDNEKNGASGTRNEIQGLQSPEGSFGASKIVMIQMILRVLPPILQTNAGTSLSDRRQAANLKARAIRALTSDSCDEIFDEAE
jgi:hypothetical protein